MSTETYPHDEVEPRWQQYWLEHETFRADNASDKPKFYVLDMFPYPSGSGLHVGHPEGYTATDIVARTKRMQGFNVLHPMGWDAFGLPAEQYAIKTGTHPRETTRHNIETFKRQIIRLGLAYDWRREVDTTDPKYFRWTQWIFLKLFERGLAYEAEVPVNWCPALGTVLANEEVIDGKSERGGHPVVRRPMRQWMLKITAYAERLLQDLEELDWPESIKQMQRNWIGRSEGAEVDFGVVGHEGAIRVYTTRPDTLFGATYMVLAPEHPLVGEITTAERKAEVEAYIEKAGRKSELERTDLAKEKTGAFTGAFAVNPVNGQEIPVWIADYVLATYGTGAIMAVPAHDERDHEFATAMGLPIVQVVAPADGADIDVQAEAYAEQGVAVNSGEFDGLPTGEFKQRVTAWLEERGQGKKAVNYRLRDWLFSRQRYWGEPVPLVHLEDGTVKALPYDSLPLTLPEVESYEAAGTGESPLATIDEWVETTDPETGAPARRETNTMPQWAGSCWYYLRYLDPDNEELPVGPEAEKYWMPVDLYVGGAEHAVLHLLYARFWHKVLYDAGFVSTKEPFQKLVNQGMILGFGYRCFEDADHALYGIDQVKMDGGNAVHPDTGAHLSPAYVSPSAVRWVEQGGERVPMHPEQDVRLEELVEKMSKSRKNVVNPDEIVAEYGADSLRLYEMFMGPLEATKPWNTQDIVGVRRFLDRVWRIGHRPVVDGDGDGDLVRVLHQTIGKVTEDVEAMRFNTAISALMVLSRELDRFEQVPRGSWEAMLKLLNPFAPHITEELWSRLGHGESIAGEAWPEWDEELAAEDTIEVVVQVNGKVRARFEVAPGTPKPELERLAMESDRVQQFIEGKTVRRVIVVPDKLVNVVAN